MLKAGCGHGVPATEAADGDAAGGGGSTGRSWGDGKGRWEERAEVTASGKSCSSSAAESPPHCDLWISVVNTLGWQRRFQDKMVPYLEISWVCGLEFSSIWSFPECRMVLSMTVLHSASFFTLLYLVELPCSNIPAWHGTHLLFMFVHHCRNGVCKWKIKKIPKYLISAFSP